MRRVPVTPTSIAGFDRLVRSRPAYSAHMVGTRPLRGETFVITGKLDESLSRAHAESLLVSWGAVVAHKVTRFTDVLLATDPTRRTTKRTDADTHRVTVLNEGAFVRTILMPLLPTIHSALTSVAAPILPLIPGDRVSMVRMDDDPDPIPAGTEGTVSTVNFDTRQCWVVWDTGRTLAVLLGADEVALL